MSKSAPGFAYLADQDGDFSRKVADGHVAVYGGHYGHLEFHVRDDEHQEASQFAMTRGRALAWPRRSGGSARPRRWRHEQGRAGPGAGRSQPVPSPACERVVTLGGLGGYVYGYLLLWQANKVARPKHRMPELEAVLRSAERQKWRVTGGGNKYFKMYCPCPAKHKKSVHCTPSDPNYKRHLLNELGRKTCWKDES